jgi:hypothetical protein
VHNRWEGREIGSERDTSNGGDGAGESLEKLALLDVENAWRESVALVVNLSDAHTVREGRDVQHVEEGGLGGSDLVSGLDELQIGRNFDGTTSDLGWDTESLEERGLSGFHASVTSGDVDIGGRNGTSTGRSGNLVGEDLVTDGLEVTVGEDEPDVAFDEWKETFVLGGIGNEALDRAADLESCESALRISSPYITSHHGVLAHQDDTLAAEGPSDFVHLLGADIVDADDEDRLVFFEETLKLIEVAGLVC